MSSIYEHRFDDESDSDDEDFYYNTDHVEMNIQLGTHDDYSNDLDDNEFPMPVPMPVPMPRETEVDGSHRETNLPAVPLNWEIPSCSTSESLGVDSEVEKELEDLRTQVRLLKQQNHEKQHEPAHSDQRPSKVINGVRYQTTAT